MTTAGTPRATLAVILDYPGPGLTSHVARAVEQLAPVHPAAAESMRQFLASIRELPLGRLQELYTMAFDFRPECSLHAGCHLFGDDPRRAVFLVGLAERFRGRGFPAGREVPDHLPLLLRFASDAGPEADEIVADAVLPALTAIARELDTQRDPYRHAVSAALRFLEATVPRARADDVGSSSPAEQAPVAAREGGRP